MRRRLLALLLLLACVPAQAATRLYFGHVRSNDAEVEFTISPAADSGWEDASEMDRSTMHYTPFQSRGLNSPFVKSVNLTASSANQDLDMQFQMPLNAGITFTSGATTVTAQFSVMELETDADITQVILGIRIIASDGTTVRATLLPVANYGTTTELTSTSITLRNKTVANGDTVQATYTTVAGDWLLVEIGYQNDGATGAASTARGGFSDGYGFSTTTNITTATDCPINETQTRCVSWIEFSNTLTSPGDPNPGPTRLYLPATGAPDVTPAFDSANWTYSDEITRYEMVGVKGTTAITVGQTVDMIATTPANSREVDRVFVSNQMAAGVKFTSGLTYVRGQALLKEVGLNDDIFSIAARLWISDITGATVLATLYPYAANIAADEIVETSYSNRPFFTGTTIRDSYTTTGGERLILEMGPMVGIAGGASPQANIRYGENATDCAIEFTPSGGSSDCAPWIEFSNTITFADVGNVVPRPAWWGRFLMVNPIRLLRDLLYGGG